MTTVDQELVVAMAKALGRIESDTRAIAAVKLARIFYSRAELRSLLTEIGPLVDADMKASKEVQRAQERARHNMRGQNQGKLNERPVGELSPEEIVASTVEARQPILNRLSAFKKAHPLVADLHAALKSRPD